MKNQTILLLCVACSCVVCCIIVACLIIFKKEVCKKIKIPFLCTKPKPGGGAGSGSTGAGWTTGGTTESGTAGGSSYNIFSSDNTCVGCLNEWKVKKSFPLMVAAVHEKDWAAYQRKKVNITYKGKTGEFIVLDYCADKDCSPKGCCTRNSKLGGGKPFLLDMESRGVTKYFGVNNPENTFLDAVQYKFTGETLDRAAIERLGAKWDG